MRKVFFSSISALENREFDKAIFRDCKYNRQNFTSENWDETDPIFLKPKSFEIEEEVRCVWLPQITTRKVESIEPFVGYFPGVSKFCSLIYPEVI